MELDHQQRKQIAGSVELRPQSASATGYSVVKDGEKEKKKKKDEEDEVFKSEATELDDKTKELDKQDADRIAEEEAAEAAEEARKERAFNQRKESFKEIGGDNGMYSWKV